MSRASPRPRPPRLAALLLAAALPSAGCDETATGSTGNGTDEFVGENLFSFAMEVTAQVRLSMDAISGEIMVAGIAGADSLTVNGVRRARSWRSQSEADAWLERLEVNVEERPDEFLVSTDEPAASSSRNYGVDYEITLPADLELAIASGHGDITVVTIKSSVDVASTNGDVILEDIQGSVSIELVNGEVDADVTLPLDGSVDIEVENGGITLRIPANTSADFYLEVGCCGWHLQSINLQDESRSPPGVRPSFISGTLGDGQGTIRLLLERGIITVIGL